MPRKPKFTPEQIEQAMIDLDQEQQPMRFGFALLIGLMAGFVVLVSLAVLLPVGYVWTLPVIIGVAVQFIAKVYSTSYRLIAGAVAAVAYMLSTIVFKDALWLIALTPVAFFITYAMAKRPLNDLQKRALWLQELKDA